MAVSSYGVFGEGRRRPERFFPGCVCSVDVAASGGEVRFAHFGLDEKPRSSEEVFAQLIGKLPLWIDLSFDDALFDGPEGYVRIRMAVFKFDKNNGGERSVTLDYSYQAEKPTGTYTANDRITFTQAAGSSGSTSDPGSGNTSDPGSGNTSGGSGGYSNRNLVKSLGKHFMLVVNNELLAYGTSAGLRYGKETIDTTNYMSGGCRDELGGIKSWELSGDAHVTLDKDKMSLEKLVEAYKLEQYVGVKFLRVSDDGEYSLANSKMVMADGEAIITSLDVKGETKGILSLSVTLQGCEEPRWRHEE